MDSLEFDIGLARAILCGNPTHFEALRMLGNALTITGRHEEALQIDQRLVKLLPKDPMSHYNLACSRSNLGQVDQAFGALEKAFELGFRDYKHLLRDRDLENVRKDPRFQKLLERRWGRRQPRR